MEIYKRTVPFRMVKLDISTDSFDMPAGTTYLVTDTDGRPFEILWVPETVGTTPSAIKPISIRVEKATADATFIDPSAVGSEIHDRYVLQHLHKKRKPQERISKAFDRPEVYTSSLITLVFSFLMLFVFLFSLVISLAGYAPAVQQYPPYQYTWTMHIPTALFSILGLAASSMPIPLLVFVTLIAYAVLFVMNFIFTLLQFLGIFYQSTAFISRNGFYGAVVCLSFLVLNGVALFGGILPTFWSLYKHGNYRPCRNTRFRRCCDDTYENIDDNQVSMDTFYPTDKRA